MTLDWDRLTRQVGKDPDFLRSLLDLYRREKAKHAQSIQKAFASGDAELLKKTSHALKGLVGNLHAPHVFEAASWFDAVSRQSGCEHAKPLWQDLEQSLGELEKDFEGRISELTAGTP